MGDARMRFSFAGGRCLPQRYVDALVSGRLDAVSADDFSAAFDVECPGRPEGPPFGFHFSRLESLAEEDHEQVSWRNEAPLSQFVGTVNYDVWPGLIDPAATLILGYLDIDLFFVWHPSAKSGPVHALQGPSRAMVRRAALRWEPYWIQIASSLDDLLDTLGVD